MIDLEPYVPRLDRTSTRRFASVPAALLFADVSGYTRLTERLSALGRVGAEVIAGVVNECFTLLIDEVHAGGGEVVRFGGDALFVAFTGPDRVRRAAVSALRMQRAIRSLASIEVPGGRVRLKMSVGLETGELWLRRCEGSWTEIVPVGPTVAGVLHAEAVARAGEVIVGPVAMADLAGEVDERGRLSATAVLRSAPSTVGERPARHTDVDVLSQVPPALRSVLVDGASPEHRAISVAFVSVPGCHGGSPADRRRVGSLLDRSFASIDDAATRFGVVPIGTDVSGDGVKFILATGVPSATEDDEERLALAALSIVGRVPSSSAGLHSGVVFCGDVGHPQRRTFTAMGDAVNLSARLMGRAQPGTVLASAAIVEVLGRRFGGRWLEPFAVKGKRGLQRAAELATPSATPEVTVRRTPLRGRGRERRDLRLRFERPGLVEVVGPRGIGTSRLLAEELSGRDGVVTVFAEVADRGTPFATARRIVDRLGGHRAVSETADPIAQASAVAADIGRLLGETGVVVVERSHHADAASIATFRALAVVLPETGGRMVLVGREPVLDGSALRLGPLDDAEIRAIAIDASERSLSDAELERIVARASGNPRFAEQVARLASVADDLPASMEAVATARLDRLPRRIRETLREIAVVGPDAERREIAVILGRPLAEIDAAIASASDLVEAQFDRVRFQDETLGEVAAAGLPVRRRRALHAAVAARIAGRSDVPVAQVAHHCHEAGDDDGTYRWAAEAAREAMAGGASASAVLQGRRAFDAGVRLGRSRRDLRLLAAFVGDAAIAAGQGEIADDLLARAIELADRPGPRADLLLRRARLARREGRLRAAATFLARARRDATGKSVLAVEIESCFLALRAGRDGAALSGALVVAEEARRRRWFDIEAWALAIVVEIRSGRDGEDWEPAAAALLRASRRSGDPSLIARAYIDLALSSDNRGMWAHARELYEQAAVQFATSGEVLLRELALRNRASIDLELGDVDAVIATLRDSIRVFAAAGADDEVDISAVMLARAQSRRGTDSSAVASLVPRVERLVEAGLLEIADFQRLGVAEVALVEVDAVSASTALLGLAERSEAYGSGHLVPIAHQRLLAVSHWYHGRPELARTHLDQATAMAREAQVLPEELMVLWTRAQLDGPLSEDDARREAELSQLLGAVSAIRYRPVNGTPATPRARPSPPDSRNR